MKVVCSGGRGLLSGEGEGVVEDALIVLSAMERDVQQNSLDEVATMQLLKTLVEPCDKAIRMEELLEYKECKELRSLWVNEALEGRNNQGTQMEQGRDTMAGPSWKGRLGTCVAPQARRGEVCEVLGL